MNKVIYLFCLSYFLLSCEKKEDVINKTIKSTINTKEEKNPKSDLKPLFLGLSPNMSDEEFQRKIKQLNGEGILENSNFDIEKRN